MKRIATIPLVWLVLIVIPGWAALGDGDLETEKSKHLGVWKAVRYKIGDQETPKEIVTSITRTVSAQRVVWKRDGKSFAATGWEIDPKQKPAWIDVIPEGGPRKGEKVLGIYRFDGEHLELCMASPGKPRPTHWDAPPGSGISLMRFEKQPARQKE